MKLALRRLRLCNTTMIDFRHRLFFLAALVFFMLPVSAQHTAVKTNALYWATTTPNLAVETKLARKWTGELSVGWNPFAFSGNRKIKHIAVQPEMRYWLCSPYAGHFLAAHLIYSHYNAGGINLPFGIFPELKDYRFQGDLGAVGIGYGHSWMLPGNHWSIEAEIGFGVGITKYGKYECATCGSKVADEKKTFFMPTKAALSVVYNIK